MVMRQHRKPPSLPRGLPWCSVHRLLSPAVALLFIAIASSSSQILCPFQQYCHSPWGQFVPEGTLDNVWRHFWLLINEFGSGECCWHLRIEAKYTIKQPMVHSTAPTTKDYLFSRTIVPLWRNSGLGWSWYNIWRFYNPESLKIKITTSN